MDSSIASVSLLVNDNQLEHKFLKSRYKMEQSQFKCLCQKLKKSRMQWTKNTVLQLTLPHHVACELILTMFALPTATW